MIYGVWFRKLLLFLIIVILFFEVCESFIFFFFLIMKFENKVMKIVNINMLKKVMNFLRIIYFYFSKVWVIL